MKRWIACMMALGLLSLGHAQALTKNADGLYVDDSGQVIDESESEWGSHLSGYYIGEGVAYPIDGGDSGTSSTQTGTGSASGGMTVTSSDGSTSGLPEGAILNPDGSVTIESGSIQIDDGSTEGSGHLTQAEWAARMAKARARLGLTTGIAYVDEKGNAASVVINSLGLGRSTVTLDGEKVLVPTSSLVWDTNAPEEQKLAVVSTTKQTYATLRAKKSQKAFVMGHCDKCTVLLVIETGKTWTMVDNNGLRGYVLTSTLTFYDNLPKQYTPGMITVKGKTTRGNTVHVRSSNKNSARQIAEFPVGTKVTVFSQDEKWTEIDVEGFHCYILTEFVTLEAAQPAPLVYISSVPETEDPKVPPEPVEDGNGLSSGDPEEAAPPEGVSIPASLPESPSPALPYMSWDVVPAAENESAAEAAEAQDTSDASASVTDASSGNVAPAETPVPTPTPTPVIVKRPETVSENSTGLMVDPIKH